MAGAEGAGPGALAAFAASIAELTMKRLERSDSSSVAVGCEKSSRRGARGNGTGARWWWWWWWWYIIGGGGGSIGNGDGV